MRSTVLGAALSLAAISPAQDLQGLVTDPALTGARIGVIVRDLATGAVLCEHDSDKGFMTASNMKLVSSSTALVTLGPDFRYRTSLVGTRSVHEGVLDGDLVLIGSGDPSFGGRQEESPTAVFERFADELITKHGLKRITGDVLGDDDCHPDEVMGEGWSWGYQSDSYAAQISGLCFAENIAQARIRPGAENQPARVALIPATDFLHPTVEAVTAAAGSANRSWVQRVRGTNRVRVGGTIPADAEVRTRKFSVENPTAYAAHVLRETLIRKGIQVDGRALDRDVMPLRPDRYGDETLLCEHESPPLRELLVTLNKISQNLYAEQVLRTASRVARGNGGIRAAASHATGTLRDLGVDTKGMRIADGSGLTRLNLVQPRQLLALLEGMWRHEHRDLWVATLPIAGVDGTIGRRFVDTRAKGRVFAKTGYISSVVALSGYVSRGESDEPLVFSILLNNFTCPTSAAKAAVDRFVVSLVPD